MLATHLLYSPTILIYYSPTIHLLLTYLLPLKWTVFAACAHPPRTFTSPSTTYLQLGQSLRPYPYPYL